MVFIYFLEKYPITTNAYSISRSEEWHFVKHKEVESLEEAKQYIRDKTKSNPEFVLYAYGSIGLKRLELLEKFCFSGDYVHKLRYFLEPCKEKIIAKLENDGIKIL